jgi:hypothetical protein
MAHEHRHGVRTSSMPDTTTASAALRYDHDPQLVEDDDTVSLTASDDDTCSGARSLNSSGGLGTRGLWKASRALGSGAAYTAAAYSVGQSLEAEDSSSEPGDEGKEEAIVPVQTQATCAQLGSGSSAEGTVTAAAAVWAVQAQQQQLLLPPAHPPADETQNLLPPQLLPATSPKPGQRNQRAGPLGRASAINDRQGGADGPHGSRRRADLQTDQLEGSNASASTTSATASAVRGGMAAEMNKGRGRRVGEQQGAQQERAQAPAGQTKRCAAHQAYSRIHNASLCPCLLHPHFRDACTHVHTGANMCSHAHACMPLHTHVDAQQVTTTISR